MTHHDRIDPAAAAAENLRQVEEKLREQRVQIQEPSTPRQARTLPAPGGTPARGGLSMGRAPSANTELAEISQLFIKPK